ncbi:MAG: exo-alpha-sialidase [Polyangiaceae bacterium]|nr:exo-alpha-sialidase [Polyangiaceae bacterium]
MPSPQALKSCLLCIVMFSLGCQPDYYDSNASDPPPAPASVLYTLKNEVSALYVRAAGQDRVIFAYNDQSGFYTPSPGTGQLTPKLSQSNAGLSYSLNAGVDWIRHGPLPPNPNCGDPVCPTLLRADPWLAQNSSRILYSHLAITKTSPSLDNDDPDAVAVSKSLDGGLTWSPMRVALHDPGQFVDKSSIALFENAAVIAAIRVVGQTTWPILVATSDDAGDSWMPLTVLNVPQLNIKKNPIVRLTSATSGYLCYMELDSMSSDGIYDLRVVRLSRQAGSSTWETTRIFALENLQIDPFIEGATANPNIGPRYWRDTVPVSFDVSSDGTHLYVAFRNKLQGDTFVMLADCVDAPMGTCAHAAGTNVSWRTQNFRPGTPGISQYQPGVTASSIVNDETIALTWYEEAPFPDSVSILVVGTYSRDGGTTWSPRYNIRPERQYWEPCPNAAATQSSPGSIGDYFQSAILPLEYGVDAHPWIVTGFTASDAGCADLGEVTFDQHIQATVW